MISGSTTPDAAGVLAAARRSRAAANAAEAEVLKAAVDWAHLHQVDDIDDAATWWSGSKTMGQDTGIPIAGEGCPLVSEFAVAEFATAVGMSQTTGRHYVGQALELAHRLPRLWGRVQSGSLAPWRARLVAENTLHLTVEAADYVDQMVAPYAHRTGPAQTQRTVDEAVARFMPDHAREVAERTAEQRYLTIEHQQVSFAGTSRIHGELDLPDALDLEDALQARAAELADLGSTETLDVRRAKALGSLARGERLLPLEFAQTAPDAPAASAEGASQGEGGFAAPLALRTSTTEPPKPSRREVVLYVHLSQDAVQPHGRDLPAWVANRGSRLVTAGQVAEWCGRSDTTGVVVKHVIDLNERIVCAGYQPSERLVEQIRLRDRSCVFPHCTRPASLCDLDHIVPYDDSGKTSSDNLACLCRLHHRMKTHGRWRYWMIRPSVFLWRSPRGHLWVRDRGGTTDLAPPNAEPPDQ